MRLLFDEQLSNRLPHLLADCYPESLHVELLRKHVEDIKEIVGQDEVEFLELGDDGSIDGSYGESQAVARCAGA